MTVMNPLHMSINTALRGSGGGGGGDARQPVESPDSLRSIAYVRVVDLVGEGEIVGFADQDNPLSCVYLNETPVANPDGSLNFRNIQIDSRVGTQMQDPLPNFDGVENEIAVGVELRQGTPWTRLITNLNLDSLRVRLSTPNLTTTNTSNGDITGGRIQYKIELQTDGGVFNQVYGGVIAGKTTSKYERSHRIELPKATENWVLRVTRLTANSESSAVQNASYVDSYTEIIEAKLRMPMSALVSIIVDAEQFPNIPGRAYRLKGRIIRVPSNYDPDTRTYTGIWDGTFQTRYSNNPAWVFYDMALNSRYGLGHLVGADQVDKWSLYKIARYCDEMVDDGKGGQEPRFTCNIVLQAQADATRVMQDLATVFRGIMYATGSTINPVGDMPEDPVYTYTAANVIEGKFVYADSNRKVRHTVALVSWSDMSDFGRAKVEYVDDPFGIERYGIQQTEVIAVGCNSQGQARRWGRYLLATERYETDSVVFNVGLDGVIVAPGKVINIADPLRLGTRRAGRVKSAAPLAVEADLVPGSVAVGDTLVVALPDGGAEERTITQISGNYLIVTDPFSAVPVPHSVWAVTSDEIPLEKYRVVGVSETKSKDGLGFAITAVQHENGKFAYADTGVMIDQPGIPDMQQGAVPAPTGLIVTFRDVADQNTAVKVVNLAWTGVPVASSYNVLWRQSNGSWVDLGTTGFTNIDIDNIRPGGFEVQVVAINALGVRSVPTFGGPYDVPAVGTAPGFVEDLRGETAQEIIDRFNADAEVAAAAAADATNKANAARDTALAAVDALAAEVGEIVNAPEWVATEQYIEGWLVQWNGRLYRAEADTIGQQPDLYPAVWLNLGEYSSVAEVAAAALTMSTANASEIEAEATRLDALYARMPAGTGELATTAMVVTEETARVNADEVLASRTTAVEARMPGGTDVLASQATVTANDTASINRDGALGSRIGVVEARMPAGTGGLATSASVTDLQTAMVSGDAANAAAITAVSVTTKPSPNLVANPSFEQGAVSWALAAGAGVAREAAYGSYLYMPPTSGGAATGQNVDGITVAGVYTLSADIFCNNNVGTKRIDFGAYNASGTLLASNTVLADNTKLGVWQRVSVQMTAPAGTTRINLRAVVESTNANASFRRFKLELGNVATAYSDELTTYTSAAATTSLRVDLDAQGVATAAALTQVRSNLSGGGNLLSGTTFDPDFGNWLLTDGAGNSYRATYPGDGGIPSGMWGIITVSGGSGPIRRGTLSLVPIKENSRFYASAYVSGNSGYVQCDFFDSAGNFLGGDSTPAVAAGGGPNLSSYVRTSKLMTSPAGTVGVRFWLCGPNVNGQFARFVRPMLEEVGAQQTAPSPWAAGGTELVSVTQTLTAGLNAKYGLYLQSGNLISGFESANNGTVAEFNILATIFKITSPSGGARTEFSNGNWRVYDASGVLRVRMGIW